MTRSKGTKKTITFAVKHTKLVLRRHVDVIQLTLDAPSPFPLVELDGILKLEVEKGSGLAWANANVGGVDEVVDQS